MTPTIFTRAFDRRVKTLVTVLGLSLVLGVAFGTHVLWAGNLEEGYAPAQPLEFRHDIMAGVNEIQCLYCHTTALEGPHAGVPTVAQCMKCHKEIQSQDAEGNLKPAIKALNEHAEKGEPIPWVKVHDLSDFVYFDHSRHMQPHTGLDCVDCHGDVASMARVERVYSLKMGWCLDCHMQPPPEGAPPEQQTRAPIHCTTCHR